MRKPDQNESQTLAEMEAEWAELLPKCLEQCAAGRIGLFLNSPVVSAFVDWPESQRLWSLTRKIRDTHAELGSVHEGCKRFLYYCSLRGTDFRSEPKLAAEFLRELNENSAANQRE